MTSGSPKSPTSKTWITHLWSTWRLFRRSNVRSNHFGPSRSRSCRKAQAPNLYRKSKKNLLVTSALFAWRNHGRMPSSLAGTLLPVKPVQLLLCCGTTIDVLFVGSVLKELCAFTFLDHTNSNNMFLIERRNHYALESPCHVNLAWICLSCLSLARAWILWSFERHPTTQAR